MATSRSFVVIVPVKPPSQGKSRLSGLPDDVREALAAAFALDTVRAVGQTPGVMSVLAVTDDHRFAEDLRRSGCDVMPDGTAGDLNATLVQAVAEASRRWPEALPAIVFADLPALRPSELAEVLSALPAGRDAFLRDAKGTGTTLYAAPPGSFAPRFGAGSAEAHAVAGALDLDTPAPSVRRDVDDLADLAAALALGVGPRTSNVLDRSPGVAHRTAGTGRPPG